MYAGIITVGFYGCWFRSPTPIRRPDASLAYQDMGNANARQQYDTYLEINDGIDEKLIDPDVI